MLKRPLFSVIIPTLNEERFLPLLLASLTKQTKKSFEVIVVDGASRDKTVELARSYASKLPSLEVVVSRKAGLPLQRNLGAVKAKGEWLIFVDADSILLPYAMDRLKAFIDEEHPKVFSTWAKPDSSVINDALLTLLVNIYWEATVLMKRPVAPGPFTVISADTFREVGGYDEGHAYNEDVDLGLRLAAKGYMLAMLRESIYVWSMRRIRRESKAKIINQYILSVLPILVFKRPFRHMPGYVMGGQMYNKKKLKLSVLRVYEKKLKLLLRELFA